MDGSGPLTWLCVELLTAWKGVHNTEHLNKIHKLKDRDAENISTCIKPELSGAMIAAKCVYVCVWGSGTSHMQSLWSGVNSAKHC